MFDDNFVRVEERPLHFESWNDSSIYSTGLGNVKDFKAIVNPLTEEIISVVGSGYQLVQNEDIFPQYDEAIHMSDLNTNGMTRKISASHNDARTKVEYTFPEHRVSIKDDDELDLTLTVLNSYDTSWRFRSILGAFRLLCANGMIVGTAFQQYAHKHTLNLDTDRAIKDLALSLDFFEENADSWRDYPNVRVNAFQVDKVFKALAKDSKSIRVSLDESHEGYVRRLGDNLWALFNTLTHWSTHYKVKNTANTSSIIINREDKVRKVLPMLDDIRWNQPVIKGTMV
jgi:hypothetical protein